MKGRVFRDPKKQKMFTKEFLKYKSVLNNRRFYKQKIALQKTCNFKRETVNIQK